MPYKTEAVTSEKEIIAWDGVDRHYKAWNKDHSIQSAFPVSCVWFYQELARRIGVEQMQHWLLLTAYGSQQIESDIDQFWLNDDLKISALEQISFLEKLLTGELAFPSEVQTTLKRLMITDATDAYTIYSKTGWNGAIGWNVGYIVSATDTYIFALNMDLTDIKNASKRNVITNDILTALTIKL